MTRIGFRYIDAKDWHGGYNYVFNLCKALLRYSSVQPVVFASKHEFDEVYLQPFQDLLQEDFVDAPGFTRGQSGLNRGMAMLTGNDARSEALFRQSRIDVVFEVADFFGWRFRLPVIGWFPDFQHRHMPAMFSQKQYLKRELGFRCQCAARNVLMVSSEDAKRDCMRYYSVNPDRLKVVPFAVPFAGLPSASQCADVKKKYDLDGPYFLVCNQFWNHKNHALIAEAIHRLRGVGTPVTVVATGGADHANNKEVFARVSSRIEELGIGDAYRLVGNVPYDDLVALRSETIAMLNPSYFEGWNTAVEEAKSGGKQMLLSDIPIHREQAPQSAAFFDPDDPKSLADCMLSFLATSTGQSTSIVQLEAEAKLRLADFAAVFESVVETAIKLDRGVQRSD